ncbi:HTH marR-type domain-containing protein [Candidatus Hydrogenisulfobacillus filiaventi]|uniref:HTH marR-type domain-containing protein n=1 Tax=Candidatus Hydrogenisulfobacillus filiaventi TaxID=2707344 RepID=A0A6F8ZI12_9FIRM|nr:MarR family transcriptional regulator [Bacillota bacterium]CAB1129404.1 HTH marR-type domain-containing protein [Candidatus Hydrogenisulfobacillus filiaventi]
MEDLLEEVVAGLEQLWRLRWRPGPVAEADGRPVHGAEWRCLWAIRRHGPLGNRELAEVLGVGAPAASLTVRRLTDLGLVEQRPDPNDRRRILVQVAPAGLRLLEEARQARQSLVAERLRRLSPSELATLKTLLDKLTADRDREPRSRA